MRETEAFDRHRRAAKNVNLLRHWMESTDLQDIPVNQFGKASKQAICLALGFAPSTANSNPELRQLFDDINKQLAMSRGQPPASSRSPRPTGSTQNAADASRVLSRQAAENDSLKRRLSALQYLEDTGWSIWL